MNMISTGAFQTEMDASNKQQTLAEKFAAVWEKKNAKAARAGGVSLMALSLAACGSSSDDTATTDTSTDTSTDTTDTTTVTPTTQSLVLTVGLDQATGGSGDDTIYATVSGAATTTTLEAFDRIDGGAGTDTMVVTLSGGDFVNAAAISNVESFQVQASAAARAFDADGLEGMTTFTNHRGSDNLTVTNMESIATVIAFDKVSTANTTSVSFKNALLAGSDDTITVNLDQVTAAENITLTSSGANDIEVVKIHSTGSENNIIGTLLVDDSANNDTMTKLVITGDAKLDADAADMDFAGAATTSTATVDASGMSGILLLDLDDADVNLRHDVTGGSNDDTFDMGDSLNANDTIDGGAGTDTVLVDSIAASAAVTLTTSYNLSNVENIQFAAAATASYSVNADGQAGLEKIAIVENATSGNVTLSNLGAGVSVELQNSTDSINIDTVTVSLKDATGAADALDVTLKGTSGHTTDNDVVDLAISNIETLNITSGFMGVTALAATEANILEDISADTALTKITIAGTEKTNITVGSEATALATVDASAAADDATIDLSNVAATTTVTGGAGNDTFTMGARLTNADSVDGGGNRTVTGDTLTATVTGLTATTGVLTVANVESVDLTNNGTAVLDVAAVTGTSSVNLFASSDTTTVNGIGSNHTIGLGKTASADQVLGTVNLALADATGTADAIAIKIAEATSATLTATAGIETANFSLSTTDTDIAESTLTVSGINIGTLNITGANADTTHTLGLGTLDTDTTTVDASGYFGVLTAQASASGTTFTLQGDDAHDVTGGAGDDSVTITSGIATYNVDGGAGTDTLAMTLDGTIQADNIANFETSTITVDNSAAAVVTLATGEYMNDADHTTLTVNGGNSISTLAIGGAMGATGASAAAIGIAAGSEATGLTMIDGSAFQGAMTLTFGDGVVDDNLTIKGGAGTDTVNAAYAGTTTEIHTQGVEYFKIQADATANIDFSDTSGMTRVYVDDDGTAAATTLTDLKAGVKVYFTTGVTGSSVTVDMENATGSADVLDVELTASTGSSTFTVTNVETLNMDVEGAFSLDLGATTMTTAGVHSTLNLTGDSQLTLAGTDTDIRTIDASGMTTGGSVVQTAREATGASTYTGSSGADTFMMLHAGDVMAGGAGSDTLDINFTAILGGIGVDLSSTTDQVTTFNGAANAATQTGFLNVDLSGYSGYGAEVTANASGSTITGTGSADVINGGAGGDTYTMTAGNDVVTLGASADTINTTEALMIAHSGTTSTIDAGAGTDILVFEAATINVVDADFRGFTNLETLTLGTGTNNVVTGANAQTAGIVTINDNTGVDTITVHDGVTTLNVTLGGADVITIEGAYDASASALTINTGTSTDDMELVFDAFQDTAADWGAAEASAAAVNAADEWHVAVTAGTATLTIYNETTTAAETITITGVNTIADHADVGSLSIDVA